MDFHIWHTRRKCRTPWLIQASPRSMGHWGPAVVLICANPITWTIELQYSQSRLYSRSTFCSGAPRLALKSQFARASYIVDSWESRNWLRGYSTCSRLAGGHIGRERHGFCIHVRKVHLQGLSNDRYCKHQQKLKESTSIAALQQSPRHNQGANMVGI